MKTRKLGGLQVSEIGLGCMGMLMAYGEAGDAVNQGIDWVYTATATNSDLNAIKSQSKPPIFLPICRERHRLYKHFSTNFERISNENETKP